MQGNNRAKLHIFFHLTTLKRNYYVFWRIKTLFHQIFRRHRTPLRKKREPVPHKKREPAPLIAAGSRIINSHLWNCITRAILRLVAVGETATYLGVCEDFARKPDAKRALLDYFFYFTSFQSSVRKGTAGIPYTFFRLPGAKLRNE